MKIILFLVAFSLISCNPFYCMINPKDVEITQTSKLFSIESGLYSVRTEVWTYKKCRVFTLEYTESAVVCAEKVDSALENQKIKATPFYIKADSFLKAQ